VEQGAAAGAGPDYDDVVVRGIHGNAPGAG
jgi:hypothetical protein